jgi:transposase
MLGPAKTHRLNEPITVSLEAVVPKDNFYRHLEVKLDLGFVRDWTRDLYAERGRPSIDPVIFFKLQLIMFLEGIRSERKLIETASLHLAHRWYLGHALDEELPDHSSLTRIRQRLGIDLFQRFFEKVVDLCQEAGLVWGQELYVDATKVEANASLDSLVPRFAYEAQVHGADLFAGNRAVEEAKPEPPDADSPASLVRLPIESPAERADAPARRPPTSEPRHRPALRVAGRARFACTSRSLLATQPPSRRLRGASYRRLQSPCATHAARPTPERPARRMSPLSERHRQPGRDCGRLARRVACNSGAA